MVKNLVYGNCVKDRYGRNFKGEKSTEVLERGLRSGRNFRILR